VVTGNGAQRRALPWSRNAGLGANTRAFPVPGNGNNIDDETARSDQHRGSEERQDVEFEQQRNRRFGDRDGPESGPGQREPEAVHLLQFCTGCVPATGA